MARGKPFQKGKSGNPGGRPKEVGDIRSLARERTVEALDTLVSVMKSSKAPAAARVSAATAILDRGYGKPSQQLAVEMKDELKAREERPAINEKMIKEMHEYNRREWGMTALAALGFELNWAMPYDKVLEKAKATIATSLKEDQWKI